MRIGAAFLIFATLCFERIFIHGTKVMNPTKVVMSHFCHAEPVEVCRDIKHLHSPFPSVNSGQARLRVTVVTFYEFIKSVGKNQICRYYLTINVSQLYLWRRVMILCKDFIVIRVAADPEPKQSFRNLYGQRPVMHSYPYGSVFAGFLEMEGRVRRIFF